jgi:multiple sugar transport system permease protein
MAATADTVPYVRAGRRAFVMERWAAAGFALPAFTLLVLLIIVPLGVLAYLSFTDYELGAVDVH